MAWSYTTTKELDGWVKSLDQAERNEVAAMLHALTRLGPSLGRPDADTLSGSNYANMKELRGRTSAAVLRIAFAFDAERIARVLCGGNKKGVSQKAFYKKLIERADRLYKFHLETLAARKKKAKQNKKG
ncbi:MAG TPA: type II toxin-antitoxin system RelE/ParE family toxin [Tepidisphaeraceae bacterium]